MASNVVPLGARLRQRREELGISQAQAARQLDVARTAYRLWEMEAARPAPDRWRAIATWLGVSVTAVLLAAELLSEQEAVDAGQTAADAGLSVMGWDERSSESEGDFFSQERSMIVDQARSGTSSSLQAASLRDMLHRVQYASEPELGDHWYEGQFRKRLACNDLAPALSRAALATTTIGIPSDTFDAARLLVSELVTNSVRHSESDWVELAISVDREVLRVEVSDQSTQSIRPRTPDLEGGWGLAMVGELANRWGVDRRADGKTIWIELDLTV